MKAIGLTKWIGTGAIGLGMVLSVSSGVVAADSTARGTTVVKNPHLRGGAKFSAADKVYTPQEIRDAQPLEWSPAPPADSRYESSQDFREAAPPASGPIRIGPPGAPNPNANREAKREFSAEWEALPQRLPDVDEGEGQAAHEFKQGGTGGDFGTKNTYTAYRGNYWDSQQLNYPWKVVGKLLIDGGGYCTAQSITGAPKNILVTAAHCVYDRANRRFYPGWTFAPAERNGAAPFGQFRWVSARVLNAWISSGSRRSDVALIRLGNNAAGRPVSYYTGWLGWRQNFPYVASLHSIGYPTNISSQWTSMCAAESFYASCEGTDVMVKGCNMTYGSSGGAWIEQYKPYEVSGYVEAVVSGPSCAGAFGQTYVGPRFSSTNFGVLCSAEGGCTTP